MAKRRHETAAPHDRFGRRPTLQLIRKTKPGTKTVYDVTTTEQISGDATITAQEAGQARRPWLGRARQAGRHDVNSRRGGDQAAVHRQARRSCRHARSAGVRLSADRARRGDQDRAVRDRRPQDLPFTVRWGEERDTDDAEGRVVAQSEGGRRRTQSRRCCRALPAPSSRCRRGFRPSRSTASAPMTSPVAAKRRARAARGENPSPRSWWIPRIRIMRCSRPNAAREPMSERSPAISAARSARLVTFRRCAATASAPFGEDDMISLEQLESLCHRAAAGEGQPRRYAAADRDRAGRHPGAGREPGGCGKAPPGPGRA